MNQWLKSEKVNAFASVVWVFLGGFLGGVLFFLFLILLLLLSNSDFQP